LIGLILQVESRSGMKRSTDSPKHPQPAEKYSLSRSMKRELPLLFINSNDGVRCGINVPGESPMALSQGF
jgi:hypothetical protein